MKTALLRNPQFRALWLGQVVSHLGDSLYYMTFIFMVEKLTHDNAMVGYVGALETLPMLLFGPLAGVLADRIDRKRIMLLSDLVSGAVLLGFAATLAFNSHPARWVLLAIPFLLSTVRCFFMPAKTAAIPSVVPAEQLMEANSLSMTTANIVIMAGLSLSAGVLGLLWALSPEYFFLLSVGLNAISFFGSAFFIAQLPKMVAVREESKQGDHPLTDLKEGLKYVATRHDLWVLTALLSVFRLMVAPFFVVYVAANNQWFGGKPQTLSWLEASFFLGMILMSAVMPKFKVERPMRWFCSGLAAVGVFVAFMAYSPNFWLFILWNLLCGIAVPVADLPTMTYTQKSVPDAFRGRVNALREMLATGVMPLGMVMGGFLVKECGLSTGFLVMGIGMAVACLVGFLDPQFRDTRLPADLAGVPCSE